MKYLLITLAILFNSIISTQAQIFQPVKWKFDIEKISDTEYRLKYTANIAKGWTAYSQFTPSDGAVPTEITYESQAGIELIGKATESGSRKEGIDDYFKVNVIKYLADKPFVIEQKIKVKDASKAISGYLTYIACDHSKCLPPTDIDFSFKIPVSSGTSTPAPGPATGSTIPTAVPNPLNKPTNLEPAHVNVDTAKNSVVTTVDTSLNTSIEASSLAFGPKIDGDVMDLRNEKIISSLVSPKSDCGGTAEKKSGFLWTFFFGFAGGLLALLTPCVFPMLPITISFFTKDTKRKGWVNGLIYGLSIIVIYVAIGLLITIFVGPEALNRLSTNWIANTLFFIIFVLFAFSFFGFYEITLPSSWSTKSDKMADKGGLIGIFFMAFTLALVSFSCTGPIIGSAIVQASTKGEYMGPFLVMLGFSIALALPFGLFAAFPAWLNTLPKSGSWMNSVKVVLGFLELALAFKFLSTADLTSHWGVLKYEIFIGLWVLFFAGMTLYLFGFIKFPHDSPLKKLSVMRIGFGAIAAAFTVYLCSTFIVNKKTGEYSSLSMLAGLAPPASYNLFLPAAGVDPTIKSKYPSYTMCANNIQCFKDYYEGIQYANDVKKPILIDFTGHGCVNCRKTEQDIWIDDRIRTILKDSVVLISLYVDDDKKLDPVYTSKASGTKLRNVGNKWARFQIENFEQNSQPLYVFANPDQEVISKPRGYVPGKDGYLEFLNCNLEQRNK